MKSIHGLTGISLILLGVIVIALIVVSETDTSPIVELLTAALMSAGVWALASSIYERIQEARLRREIQENEHQFVFGAASHMSQVAYDKHAKFAEEYMEIVYKAFHESLQHGPRREAGQLGAALVRLRQKYALWLTKEIDSELERFEQVLIKIGANEGYLEHLPTGEERSKVVRETFDYFRMQMDNKGEGKSQEDQNDQYSSMYQVIETLRDILGVQELTTLRKEIQQRALRSFQGAENNKS